MDDIDLEVPPSEQTGPSFKQAPPPSGQTQAPREHGENEGRHDFSQLAEKSKNLAKVAKNTAEALDAFNRAYHRREQRRAARDHERRQRNMRLGIEIIDEISDLF